MHDLVILEKHIIHISSVSMLASMINDNLPNTIYFRKSKQLIFYKELNILYSNDMTIGIKRDTDINTIKRIETNVSDIVAIEIITHNLSKISYTSLDITALGGFKLSNSYELAIEYYNSLVFDILYDSKVLTLSRINPIDDNSSNLLEDLDIGPSKYLTEEDIDIIDLSIRQDNILYNHICNEVKSVRSLANKYSYNLKQFQISRYTININILEDIRTIRFNELLKGLKENEYSKDSDRFY